MNKKLLSALKGMNEVDYIMLGYYRKTSDWCRSIMNEFSLVDSQMQAELGLTKQKFHQFKMGAYDYTIMDWAKLQSIYYKHSVERIEKETKEQVTFPPYEYSQPANKNQK